MEAAPARHLWPGNARAPTDPLVLPLKPGFNQKGAEGDKGCNEDFHTGHSVPTGRSASHVDQQAEKNEESAVDRAGKMDGLVIALHPLQENGAVKQDEEGGSLQQSHEAQPPNRSIEHEEPGGELLGNGESRFLPCQYAAIEVVDTLEPKLFPGGEGLRTAPAAAAVNEIKAVALQLRDLFGEVFSEEIDQPRPLDVTLLEFTRSPDIDDGGTLLTVLRGEQQRCFPCINMDDRTSLGRGLLCAGQGDREAEKEKRKKRTLHPAKNTGPAGRCKRPGPGFRQRSFAGWD